MQETWVWSLDWEDPLEKGKATHSSVLAWRIPWTVTVHGVTKCQTQLSDFHFHFSLSFELVSVQFSSVVSDSLRPHESRHARPPCPSPAPRVYSNSCPSGQWCHPAISPSVVPFSSCPQSLPASGSFPVSQLFAWGLITSKVTCSPFIWELQFTQNFPKVRFSFHSNPTLECLHHQSRSLTVTSQLQNNLTPLPCTLPTHVPTSCLMSPQILYPHAFTYALVFP